MCGGGEYCSAKLQVSCVAVCKNKNCDSLGHSTGHVWLINKQLLIGRLALLLFLVGYKVFNAVSVVRVDELSPSPLTGGDSEILQKVGGRGSAGRNHCYDRPTA